MTPFGDRALRFEIPAGAPRRRLFTDLLALPGVADVVLTEDIGCIVFEDEHSDRSAIAPVLAACGQASTADAPRRAHTIDVIYDGEDLGSVAHQIGRSTEDLIRIHSEADYRVAMLGFMPGFAYLAGLPRELRLPRRAPRPRVPAGSVAIAADYTGIYPFASPGGWHLLGRAPRFVPFTLDGEEHAALAIGDAVRFVPSSDPASAPARAPAPLPIPNGAHLEITRAAGFAILVDGGRRGRMHEGVPPGGPLVRSALARANTLVGNAPGACAIELSGTFEVTAREGSVVVADDRAPNATTLAEGARYTVSTEGKARVRYLTLAGGIDAPVVLGGRGTLLAAGIGKLLGKGTSLGPSSGQGRLASTERLADDGENGDPIEIMAGPDAGTSLDPLTAQDLRIGMASDRTGTRLEGLPPGASMTQAMTQRSTPMVLGAIELTPAGPIVLGPDHPTTGGYPVIAVVRSSSLDRFFARPIGASVRFRVS